VYWQRAYRVSFVLGLEVKFLKRAAVRYNVVAIRSAVYSNPWLNCSAEDILHIIKQTNDAKKPGR
jgi:hypothetical protein